MTDIDLIKIVRTLAATEFTEDTRPKEIISSYTRVVDKAGNVVHEGTPGYRMTGGKHPLGGHTVLCVGIDQGMVDVSVQVAPATKPRGLRFSIPVKMYSEEVFGMILKANQKRRELLMEEASRKQKKDEPDWTNCVQHVETESIPF